MFRERLGTISASGAAVWLVFAAAAVFSLESGAQAVPSKSVESRETAAAGHFRTFRSGGGLARDALLRARLLQEQAEHEQAVALLRQALQATRMTLGLHHADQLAIIDSLVASEVARENWRRVDELNALLLHLYGRLYAGDSEKLEQGLEKITRWHVDALRYDLDGRAVAHLREARELFKARLRLARQAKVPDIRKIDRLQEGIRIAETHLLIQSDNHMDALRKRRALHGAWLLSSLD